MSMALSLSDRIKEYESQTQMRLIKKLPVIIRLDGRKFSKFTKGFEKPFDEDLSMIFQIVALELRKRVDNVKFIYSQSDEISLLLTDWDHTKEIDGGRTDTWYDYRIQKMVSVISSEATMLFNRELCKFYDMYSTMVNDTNTVPELIPYYKSRRELFSKKQFTAMFDARAFNLPLDEVTNYFIFRQQDALRNSISGFARKYYSTKQLQGIKNPDKLEMVKRDFGIDFDSEISQLQKVGFAIITTEKDNTEKEKFQLDLNIPMFKDDRDYIERYL